MRAAVYVRVSTLSQVHHQTIELQLDRLRAYAQEQGLTLCDELIFRDEGYSAQRISSGASSPAASRLT
jgi:DNA invertase Pin-like site-specific DNA recombinase